MNEDNEVDLYQFAKLFDAAIASNNPGVKKALRNFMLVASIAEAEELGVRRTDGLVSVFDRVSVLEKRMADMELTMKNAMRSNQHIGGNGLDRYGGTNPYKYSTTDCSVPGKSSALYKTFSDIIDSKEGKP
jgi:hypothetical protein